MNDTELTKAMKRIETTFTEDDFLHEQIARGGMAAIYRKTKGRQESYEVVLIRENKAHTRVFDGKEKRFEAKETYPTSRQWGDRGWSYQTLSDAKAKFKELLDRPTRTSTASVAGVLIASEGQDSGQGVSEAI